MSEITSQRVAELFQAALLRDRAHREGFLAHECEGRPELLGEVAALLQCDEEAGAAEFWESSAAQAEAIRSAQETEVIGQTIGPYKLLEEISSGGMGTVYLAVRDDAEYQKCVALKLIKRGMDTELIVGRFRNERQILANLEHPNIAPVGRGDHGRWVALSRHGVRRRAAYHGLRGPSAALHPGTVGAISHRVLGGGICPPKPGGPSRPEAQ
jgi:hypothetical protein